MKVRPIEGLGYRRMRIRISEMDDGPIVRRYELSHEWMMDALSGVMSVDGRATGSVAVTAALSGTTVTVTGEMDATFDVPCSRCLGPAEVRVSGRFRLVVSKGPGPRHQEDELELGPEDLELAYYEGQELDLAPHFREQLILSVPIAPLCQPDCWPEWFDGTVAGGDAAVRSRDGQHRHDRKDDNDKKIDPRWAALVRLSEKGSGG